MYFLYKIVKINQVQQKKHNKDYYYYYYNTWPVKKTELWHLSIYFKWDFLVDKHRPLSNIIRFLLWKTTVMDQLSTCWIHAGYFQLSLAEDTGRNFPFDSTENDQTSTFNEERMDISIDGCQELLANVKGIFGWRNPLFHHKLSRVTLPFIISECCCHSFRRHV